MRQFKNSDGQMMIGDLRATELAERFGTPLYVTDENAVRENYRRIKGAFKPYMPVRVHYACKANAALAILRVLQQEGSFIDAVSIGEVDSCLRAGFPPERILFTGVNVSNRELEALVNRSFQPTAGSKVVVGSFLAVDAEALNRKQARKLWDEAAKAGEPQGKQLIPELDAPLPPGAGPKPNPADTPPNPSKRHRYR